ncbi:putative methionine--tRNA ligase [Porphyridium purpureum]|uniref:Putative methionine--tRNA ligase n=1 Tax=Porphyridium purpureum TaxID=35688 RepID=A0A5J4Z2W6_PORPP|nr:putative methionine--tRNA ligase [Porphyridium purpureum]|eukprot:POR0149..scf295_1
MGMRMAFVSVTTGGFGLGAPLRAAVPELCSSVGAVRNVPLSREVWRSRRCGHVGAFPGATREGAGRMRMSSLEDGSAALETAAGNEGESLPLTELSRLEIRVGKIIKCEKHPEADSLYVEEVDVGDESGARVIVSGLVSFVPLEEMVDRTVIVLCNLKPRNMRGISSHGMLLCASNEDHSQVDPLTAPEGVPIGALVTFEGHRSEPAPAGNRASKAFDKVAKSLRTDATGVAMFEQVPFATPSGPCFSPKKLVGPVS